MSPRQSFRPASTCAVERPSSPTTSARQPQTARPSTVRSKLQNSGIMLDWFPFRGSFRLSGGVTVYNNKGLSGTANLADGKQHDAGQRQVLRHWQPGRHRSAIKLGGNAGGRVSFGWGNLVPKPGHHFSFDTEFGIEFVSKPTVALGFTGNVCPSANYQSTTDSCTGGNQNASTYAPVPDRCRGGDQNKLQSDRKLRDLLPHRLCRGWVENLLKSSCDP